MRLARLTLERYGHVSGEVLDFPPDAGLHVVLGANEAGKSTALEAIADGLFGFSTKHSRKLNHPDDPRIGFVLRAADGTQASFVRRKAGRDKLLDEAGTPLPETALARFLGGTQRERFRDVFGLDGERLRQAGRAIMTEQGEAGAAILQAQTGLRGLRDTVGRLDDDAKTLFGDGRGLRRISAAAGAVKENRRLVAERSLSGADYLRAAEREAALTRELDAIALERKALRAEQAKLDRVRRTAPVRGALAEIAGKLAALGPVAPLPPDAATLYARATAKRDQAARDMQRDQDSLGKAAEARQALHPDPAVLREAAAISDLAADLSRIAEVRRNLLTVSGQAATGLAAIDDMARRLGVPERGTALRDRIPNAAARRTAERLLKQHAQQAGARDTAAQALTRAERTAQHAAEALAALPPPVNADPLRDAVEATRGEGAIAATLDEAAAQRQAAEDELARALAALPLWTGDAAALEATSLPLEAEATRLGAALTEAAATLAAAEDALRHHGATLTACRAAMAGFEAAGALPTAEAIAATRARRDAAWHLVRRCLVENGAPPSADDWPGEPPPATSSLPDLLGRLLKEADALADSRNTGMARVHDWEARHKEQAELAALHPNLATALQSAQHHHEAAHATWRTAWAPAGVEPLEPAAMREWVRARAAVLAAARAARDAAARHARLTQRHDALRTRLLAVLPGTTGDLTALLQHASRQLRMLEQHAAKHVATAERAAKAIEDRGTARDALDAIDRQATPWREAWLPVAGRLGLPAEAEPDAATDALTLWAELEKALQAWSAFDVRLHDMQSSIGRHEAALAGLAATFGLPVQDTLAADLVARLQAARDTSAELERLHKDAAALDDALAAHERDATAAEAGLAALRRTAGASDDAALQDAIARAAEHAALKAATQDRTTELHKLDDGKSDADLAAEAATIDVDTIPGRLHEIATRTASLDTEAEDRATELAQLRHTLHAMAAGQDVAGPAQAIQDSLAEIEDAAHRYIRLRLAHALLRGGVDGFRRSQQGPLLAKAGELFHELTGGRYVRLEQDLGDRNEPVIVAVRPDGSTCPAGLLSEGTTDQLFLALRLASIALEAAASEPLPFIADDLLVNFDDARAAAALRLLARFGQVTQVILFTHHPHLLGLLDPGSASVHRLPRELAA